MSEERPQHTQEPAEGDEGEVGTRGAERSGEGRGAADKAGDTASPSDHPAEPAEGAEDDVEAPGADRPSES